MPVRWKYLDQTSHWSKMLQWGSWSIMHIYSWHQYHYISPSTTVLISCLHECTNIRVGSSVDPVIPSDVARECSLRRLRIKRDINVDATLNSECTKVNLMFGQCLMRSNKLTRSRKWEMCRSATPFLRAGHRHVEEERDSALEWSAGKGMLQLHIQPY